MKNSTKAIACVLSSILACVSAMLTSTLWFNRRPEIDEYLGIMSLPTLVVIVLICALWAYVSFRGIIRFDTSDDGLFVRRSPDSEELESEPDDEPADDASYALDSPYSGSGAEGSSGDDRANYEIGAEGPPGVPQIAPRYRNAIRQDSEDKEFIPGSAIEWDDETPFVLSQKLAHIQRFVDFQVMRGNDVQRSQYILNQVEEVVNELDEFYRMLREGISPTEHNISDEEI